MESEAELISLREPGLFCPCDAFSGIAAAFSRSVSKNASLNRLANNSLFSGSYGANGKTESQLPENLQKRVKIRCRFSGFDSCYR